MCLNSSDGDFKFYPRAIMHWDPNLESQVQAEHHCRGHQPTANGART